MLEHTLFWLGMVGLLGGIGVGISLLEHEDDPFVRNVMFSIVIACAIFIYLFTLGDTTSAISFLFGVSFFMGGVAAIFIAHTAHGNLRAAFIAGGLAGVTLQIMIKILPHGTFGFTGFHDFADVIDIGVTILTGIGIYYLLRNWGKDDENWD